MNILFIEEVDWLNKVVYEIHSIPELLSLLGHKVFFMDFEENWSKDHLLDLGTLRTKKSLRKGRAHDEAIVTLIRPGFLRIPTLDRISVSLTFYFEIEKTIKENKIDVIFLFSVPTNGFQAVRIAKKHHIPIIYRSMDIPHLLVLTRRSQICFPIIFLKWITIFVEKWVHRYVDEILTLSPKLSSYVTTMGADPTKVKLLPFGVDMNKFNPFVDTKMIKEKLGITSEDRVVVFIGTLFAFSGLDRYLQQFGAVIKEIPKVKLVIVGGGILSDRLTHLVKNLKLAENVILTGFQPFDTMPQYINLADICINPFEVNGTTQDIIPGKIIQYLSCAKPVLATPLPGMISLLPDIDHGVIYSGIDEFAVNTVRLLRDRETARAIGDSGYLYVKNNHDEKKLNRRLDMILKQITKDTYK
jgi:glycosyltransferase involved in cell wall biosynthesis